VICSAAFAGAVSTPAETANATIAPRNAFLVVNFFMCETFPLTDLTSGKPLRETLKLSGKTPRVGVSLKAVSRYAI
jgi:hypothetical protein